MAAVKHVITALGLAAVLTAGISTHSLLGRPPPPVGSAEERAEWVMRINSETGLSLPKGARVIKVSDGDPRDGTTGYFEWIVFSMSPLGLPYADLHTLGPLVEGGDRDVVPLERSIWPFRLADPRGVTRANWRAGRMDVYLTVVETRQGFYSRVQTIRQDR